MATLKLTFPNLSKPTISLIVALCGFTFAGIFLRLSQQNGVPSMAIASLRLLFAFALLTPIVMRRYRDELAHLTRRDWAFSTFAGVWIAIHFITIIMSLEKTSIMLNQVIINTGPIWVAMMEMAFLKVRFAKHVWVGLAIALVGGALIALSHSSDGTPQSSEVMLGNALALVGSVAGGIYIIFGRVVRQKMSLLPYLWILYGVGGFFSAGVVLFSGMSLVGYTLEGYFWVLMVTLVPTLVGHSSFNYALAYLPATLVTLTGQVVSVTAAITAFLIFAEAPTPAEVLAGAVIMFGVFIANQRH